MYGNNTDTPPQKNTEKFRVDVRTTVGFEKRVGKHPGIGCTEDLKSELSFDLDHGPNDRG